MFTGEIKLKGQKKALPFFSLSIFNQPKPSLVISFNAGEFKILGFKRNKNLIITFADKVSFPAEVLDKNEVKDEEAASVLVRESLKKITRDPIAAFVVIPEEVVFSKMIQKISGEIHTRDDLVSRALPQPRDEMVVGIEEIKPLSRQITHNDFELWAVPREYLENQLRWLKKAKIEASDYLPESLGIVQVLFPKKESEDATLVISLSRSRSILVIFAGRAAHFTSVLSGLDDLQKNPTAQTEFIAEIRQAISFYKDKVLHEHGASSQVNRIVVLGKIPEDFEDRIAFNTQLRVSRLNPFKKTSFINSQIESFVLENEADFLPLLGAAMLYSAS